MVVKIWAVSSVVRALASHARGVASVQSSMLDSSVE